MSSNFNIFRILNMPIRTLYALDLTITEVKDLGLNCFVPKTIESYSTPIFTFVIRPKIGCLLGIRALLTKSSPTAAAAATGIAVHLQHMKQL